MKQLLILNTRNQHNEYPVNITENDTFIFKNEIDVKLPAVFLNCLSFVCINAEGVVSKNFKIADINLTESNKSLISVKYSAGVILLKRPVITFKKNLVLFFDQWSYNYFHFLLDVLPKVLFVSAKFHEPTIILPKAFPSAYQQFLHELGYKNFLFIGHNELLYAHKIYVPSLIFSPSGVFSTAELHSLKKIIENKFVAEVPQPNRLLYISRKNARCRKILNEDALLNLLKAYGFESISLENYNIIDQIKLFQNCKILLSIHGAGLANMLFMQPGTNIIEFRLANTVGNNTFFRLATALKLQYFYQLCKGNADDFQKADLNVDVEALKDLIDRIH